jgi:hypothetical protein
LLNSMIKIDHIKEQLSPFYLTYYRFSYIAEEDVHFTSFKGVVFKGGLGNVLKDKACLLPGAQCHNCSLNDNCIYVQIFENPIPAGSKYLTGQTYAPHPFVIEPPLENKDYYKPGEVIDFKLILVGSAVRYLPYFIYAFIELGSRGIGKLVHGKRGKCYLNRVESLGGIDGEPLSTLYLNDCQSYLEPSVLLTLDALINNSAGFIDHCQFLKVSFLTPTSIKNLEQINHTLDFKLFIKNVLRRFSTLSYFYCNHELKLDYAMLLDHAGRITVNKCNLKKISWGRFSGRQQQRFLDAGFHGEVSFYGDLDLFVPFVLIGQFLHIGKGTSYGFGKFIIGEIY